MRKPGITQLLVASALDPALCRRLEESPDAVFPDFDLSEEEKDLLRRPDHRLLPLLGAALRSHSEPRASMEPVVAQTGPVAHGPRALPDLTFVLTVVPCLQPLGTGGVAVSYAAWVNPLAAGADPASLPAPAGATLPGQPLTPLRAVVQVSALELRDAAGNLQVGMSASLRHSSNMASPTAPASPDVHTEAVQAAVREVLAAGAGERYGRLLDLLHVLRGGSSQ